MEHPKLVGLLEPLATMKTHIHERVSERIKVEKLGQDERVRDIYCFVPSLHFFRAHCFLFLLMWSVLNCLRWLLWRECRWLSCGIWSYFTEPTWNIFTCVSMREIQCMWVAFVKPQEHSLWVAMRSSNQTQGTLMSSKYTRSEAKIHCCELVWLGWDL